MVWAPGSRIGGFEIVGVIGAGGMGVVYRAHDPKLRREVAIKTLPTEFAADAARLNRFQREAQAIAAPITPTSSRSIPSRRATAFISSSWS